MKLGDTGNADALPFGKPLDGVRVLALEQMQALPYATQLLARLGAEVVKVESTKGGDLGPGLAPRHARPGGPEPRGDLPAQQPRQALDLRRPQGPRGPPAHPRHGAEASTSWPRTSRPGALPRMGLGYDDLAAVHPEVRLRVGVRVRQHRTHAVRRLAGLRRHRRGHVRHLRLSAAPPTSRRRPSRSAPSATSAPPCSPPSACSPRCATATGPASASTSTWPCSTPWSP